MSQSFANDLVSLALLFLVNCCWLWFRCSHWVPTSILSRFPAHWRGFFQNQGIPSSTPHVLLADDRRWHFVWHVRNYWNHYSRRRCRLLYACRLLLNNPLRIYISEFRATRYGLQEIQNNKCNLKCRKQVQFRVRVSERWCNKNIYD